MINESIGIFRTKITTQGGSESVGKSSTYI